MATPVLKPAIASENMCAGIDRGAVLLEAESLNLPENADSPEQRKILDALPALVFLERAGKIVFANAEARQMLGLDEGEWTPCPVEDVLWGLLPGTAEPQTLLTGTRRGSPFHATMPTRGGHLQPVEGTCCLLDAALREAVIVAHPGGREQAPKSRLVEDVLASLPEAVAIEYERHLIYTNPAFTRMFGYTAEEAGGGNLRQLIVPETRLNEQSTLEMAADQQECVTVETVRMNRAGELLDVCLQSGPLLVEGAKVGRVFTFREIGERKQTEAKLEHDAMHDVLTGLPNRALFTDRLNLALMRRVRRPDQSCGVLFLDLDHFKETNDALGHAAGDVLLLGVADRLRAALRPQDSAARLGGDEFAVLVENILSVGDLEIVARRILQEMDRPFDIFGRSVRTAASIGAAMAGSEHTVPELLVRDADFAMYRAKQVGGGRYEIFDEHMEVCATSLQEREQELRQALERREFEFQYQPVFRLGNGRLEGFESVLRWRRPDGTLDSFRDLLAVAEDSGISITLSREALEAACRQLRSWSAALPGTNITLAVNLTYRQFYHPDMVAQLQKVLVESGVDPSQLLLEVPEIALNENPDAALAILQRMVDCHVRVGLDDFGNGLGSLNHLVRLPISQVKLAPRLAVDAASTGRPHAVLQSLIQLGRTLGVQVVAQGIETHEQLQAFGRMGCEFGQGPLLSLPLEPELALKLAESGYGVVVPLP